MIIVDTSVVYKWIVDEELPDTQNAKELLRLFLTKQLEITAPDILLYELSNIFAFKSQIPGEEKQIAWIFFKKLHLPVVFPTLDFIEACIDFAQIHTVSIYDGSYAVLAKKNKCNLVTADAKFVRKVNLPFVKLLNQYSS